MSKYINEELLKEDVIKLTTKQAEEEVEELGAKMLVLGAKLNNEFDYDVMIRFVETQLRIAAISKYGDEIYGGNHE